MSMPPWERYIGLPLLLLHDKVYKATDGRIGHIIPFGPPALILHTVGAKTGLARANSLTYARDGADYLVVALRLGCTRKLSPALALPPTTRLSPAAVNGSATVPLPPSATLLPLVSRMLQLLPS